jgi:hypothetical protein
VTILGRGDLAPPRRYRRRRWPRLLLVLVVLAAAAAGAWYGYDRWIADDATDTDTLATPCVTPTRPPGPAEAGDVRLRVLNGTKRVGLAHDVAKELRKRGFEVTRVGNSKHRATHTVVSFAPADRPAALALAEQLPEPSKALAEEAGAELALVIGADFTDLADARRAAANRAADLAAASPSPPPCASSPDRS